MEVGLCGLLRPATASADRQARVRAVVAKNRSLAVGCWSLVKAKSSTTWDSRSRLSWRALLAFCPVSTGSIWEVKDSPQFSNYLLLWLGHSCPRLLVGQKSPTHTSKSICNPNAEADSGGRLSPRLPKIVWV